MEILWGFPQVFSVGMGWLWGLKFNPHGSPAILSAVPLSRQASLFIFRMFSFGLFYSFVFYVCLCCVLFLYFIFVLPRMA